MKQSDPLELVVPGTLHRPGPVGRLVRLVLGVLCLFVVYEVIHYWQETTSQPISTLGGRVLILLAPLCITNYVVNIGFSRSWGNRPLLASVAFLLALAGGSWLATGSADSPILGIPLNLWIMYFYGHLGVSFVLSAVIATPGCEMRSLPELIGRVRGRPGAEHHCPAAFITWIDQWEQRHRISSTD